MESNKDKIQRIKKELKNDPLNVESMIKLAEAYFCELRFKKSSKIFEELLTMDKNSDEYWFLYGMSLYYSNQSEEAIAAFKRAREIYFDYRWLSYKRPLLSFNDQSYGI